MVAYFTFVLASVMCILLFGHLSFICASRLVRMYVLKTAKEDEYIFFKGLFYLDVLMGNICLMAAATSGIFFDDFLHFPSGFAAMRFIGGNFYFIAYGLVSINRCRVS
jgi:hypothetical protein